MLSTGAVHLMELATTRGTVLAVEPRDAARHVSPLRRPLDYPAAMGDETLSQRLEMLLVLMWLDDGSPSDGAVALSVATAAAELDAGAGREGLLAVMTALG